jgi:hypothetical protein
MGPRARSTAQLGALHLVPWGAPALARLDGLIAAAQVDDPLAPVAVVVPSSHAGTTVRRRLARRDNRTGLVNVGFVSFPQLAETLAAPRLAAEQRLPADSVATVAAIRSSLLSHPSWFRAASTSPSALAALARTLDELDGLEPAVLDRLAEVDERASHVVALLRDVDARTASYARDRDVLLAAVAAVRDGGRPTDEVGHVIVHLPRRLRPLDLELAAALAEAGRLSVVLGTGDDAPAGEPDDGPAQVIRSKVGLLLPVAPDVEEPDLDEPGGEEPEVEEPDDGRERRPTIRLVRAPDPHEEVRHAVRTLLAAAERGVPADRMAIVARLTDPYAALAHEELRAAGLPHHGPTGLRLAQSVAGRVLLGAIDLLANDLPRTDLFQWLRSGPVRGADGHRLRVDDLDRIARETGIAGGYESWCERLDVEAARLRERIAEREASSPPVDAVAPDEGESAPASPGAVAERPRVDRLSRRLDDVVALRALIDWLGEGAAVLAEADGWPARASWAVELLRVTLGPPERFGGRAVGGAPAADDRPDEPVVDEGHEAAYLAVLQTLGSLATLDAVDPSGDAAAFRVVLGLALDAPGPPAGRFGHGVFVGSLAEAVGADHEVVAIVGAAEGIYPPRGQDDPVLPDAIRARLGDAALPPRRPDRVDERRDHVGAVAGSAEVVLSFPRADTRAQRERYPSRWFLDEVRRRWGRPPHESVGMDELDTLADLDPRWWTDVVSFVGAVDAVASGDGQPPLITVAERSAAAVLAHRRLGPVGAGPDERPRLELPADRPELQRAAAAVLDRQAGRFSAYTGRVGEHPRLRFVDDRVGSATALESWATCPFRYFLRQVLWVRPLDERAEADDINALDRGSYVHEVLERVVDDSLTDTAPLDVPLGPAHLDRLRQLAAEVGERYRADGRTGRPLLWRLRSRQLLRLLEQIVKVDRSHRLGRSVQPVAVELSFGSRDDDGAWIGVPPVVIDLSGDRSVAFRGYVDRVDRSADRDRLVVIDYKTGRSDKYGDVKGGRSGRGDIVGRGQHLQLCLYAMAAETAYGEATSVSAFFWFVEQVTEPFVGGEIDEWARQRLVDVLETIVGGIEHGWFPARPGDENIFGFANCGFCDYNRICPSARAEQWEQVRLAPELAAYRDLAEGDLVTPEGVGP